MKRRDVLPLLGGAVAVWPLAARAQQRSIPLIGVLMGSNHAGEATRLAAFREGLERLGYVEGRTIRIEVRYAEGLPERYGSLARELVALAPDLIVCAGRRETAALQAATRTIPIVFFQVNEPVENGFVASLARPGGNTTGFAGFGGELDAKRLELLKEMMPSLSRAIFLINPVGIQVSRFANAEAAAKTLGIALQRIDASTPDELTAALARIQVSSTEALIVQIDSMFGVEFARILDFAAAHRPPVVHESRTEARKIGVLMAYGFDSVENTRRGASYVDRILKGAKPADLPVQLPTRFLLTVNLRTAKALGLTIPHAILLRADEVIE